MELFLRVVFSLGAVLGLVWFLARMASHRMGGAHPSVVRLLGRQSLGRTSSVAVVAVGERVLVVGVTEHGVRLLAELDADEVDVPISLSDGMRDDRPSSTGTPAAGPTPGLVAHGSVLSPTTWRQAWHAATTRGGPSA